MNQREQISERAFVAYVAKSGTRNPSTTSRVKVWVLLAGFTVTALLAAGAVSCANRTFGPEVDKAFSRYAGRMR